MADWQSVARRKRRQNWVSRDVYPSPSLGCFLAYITINAVLVCLEWIWKMDNVTMFSCWFSNLRSSISSTSDGYFNAFGFANRKSALTQSISHSRTHQLNPIYRKAKHSSCVQGCQCCNIPQYEKYTIMAILIHLDIILSFNMLTNINIICNSEMCVHMKQCTSVTGRTFELEKCVS